MIRTTLMAGAIALGLVASAGAQPAPSMSPPAPGMASRALPTPDFLTAAGQSDQFEIREGKLAAMRSHNAKVRAMAQMMIHDHTKSTDMIKAAVAKAGMPAMAPPGLAPDQQQMMAQLKATSGAAFDKMYVDQQVMAHTKTLGVMSAYAQNGPMGPIRTTAGKIVPVVQTHLDKWQALQGSMG